MKGDPLFHRAYCDWQLVILKDLPKDIIIPVIPDILDLDKKSLSVIRREKEEKGTNIYLSLFTISINFLRQDSSASS